jgi:CMP/dCMP kinase
MIITIDGPTASGKSSLARALAKKRNMYYVNTGYLYRAVAYLLIKEFEYDDYLFHHPRKDDIQLMTDPNRFVYQYDPVEGEKIFFDGADISAFLGSPDIARGASVLGLNGIVRLILDTTQRKIAEQFDCIIEGRDSGSTVFPNADIKFYITASDQIRAERWYNDPKRRSSDQIHIKEVMAMLKDRDTRDSQRTLSPLVIPEGAIVIDNSYMTFDTMVVTFEELIEKKLKENRDM